QPGGDLEPEAGLARAARAGERDETRGGDKAAHFGELSVAADEARHLCREVVQLFRVVERRKGWEGRRKADCRLCRLAGMDTHADADSCAGWPWVRDERPLHLDVHGHAGAPRREHREERVAL